tara:strand:+ start:347 stop:499 length:153 start_codon:yes stop_codon:yes gene_type:complete
MTVEEINAQYEPEFNELKLKFKNNTISEKQYYEYLGQLNTCYSIDLQGGE